jgi:hypothetical protein
LALTPEKPLLGHRSGKKAATLCVAFIKNSPTGSGGWASPLQRLQLGLPDRFGSGQRL